MKQEEKDGELYKTPKLLETIAHKLNKVDRYKQHGMTSGKDFYKKLKEGKAGY